MAFEVIELYAAWPFVVYPAFLSIILAVLGAAAFRSVIKPRPEWSALAEPGFMLFAVAMIGAAVGEIGGLSRTSVVGTIIPAVLTIVGGSAVYLFGSERAKSNITTPSLLVFVFSFFVTFVGAASVRERFDDILFCRDQFAKAAISSSANALKNMNHVFGAWCQSVQSRR